MPKQTAPSAGEEEGSIGTWEDPSTLVPWKKNPKDPKKFEAKVLELMESIQTLGFGPPVVARKSDRQVAIGNTRLEAGKRLGRNRVPVRWIECDDATFTKLALADNKLGEDPGWDHDAVDELLFEVGGDVPGFDDAVEPKEDDLDDLATREREPTTPEFWISVRGPLLKQADVIDVIREKLELEGCTVSAGVVGSSVD